MVEKETRVAQLKAKLATREGRPGFTANCEELRAEIARLEREIADGV